MNSNGYLQFTRNASVFGNTGLPAAGFTNTIFGHWDDLFTSDAASGNGIFTSVSGIAPNCIFNIEWQANFCCDTGAPTVNFEIRLYQEQQRFDIIYGNVSGSGETAIVGVQKDNTTFTEYSFNQAVLSNGLMITGTLAPPTAASVLVSGRITTILGKLVPGARVALTDQTGETRVARTNPLGYYRFEDVPAGQTYIFEASHKRYFFSPQVLLVSEQIENLNFTAIN